MRISVIGQQLSDSLAENLSYTLRKMGHSVQEIDQDKLLGLHKLRYRFRRLSALLELSPQLPTLRDRRIYQQIATFHPDIVLNTYANWGPRSVMLSRRSLGKQTKFLFLYPDANANLGREYPLAADYDALFFKDRFAVDLFRSRLGLNAYYLPEACNPDWHYPVQLDDADQMQYGCDLSTVGNMYYYRARILEHFSEYDMKIWGNSYPVWLDSEIEDRYMRKYVTKTEKAKAFQAAKIVINTLSHKEITSANARTFEAAGCGGFQIVDSRPAIAELFRIDEEIVAFSSLDELKEKVRFYLNRSDLRRRIAEAGCQRAHEDHSYEKRLREVLLIASRL